MLFWEVQLLFYYFIKNYSFKDFIMRILCILLSCSKHLKCLTFIGFFKLRAIVMRIRIKPNLKLWMEHWMIVKNDKHDQPLCSHNKLMSKVLHGRLILKQHESILSLLYCLYPRIINYKSEELCLFILQNYGDLGNRYPKNWETLGHFCLYQSNYGLC